MRILFLAQRVPYPLNRGDKITTYHYIRSLARTHEVTVACLADGPADLPNVEGLRPLVHAIAAVPRSRFGSRVRVLAALATGRPLTVAYFDEPALHRRVKELVSSGRFDLAVVFGSGVAQYVEEFSELPRVIQFADLDSRKWAGYANATLPPMRWVYRTEAARLLRYERHLATTFTRSLVCSPRELYDFHRLIPGVPVTSLPNGVDLDYFQPTTAAKNPHELVFTGVMNYFPNVDGVVWFCRDVLPLVRAAVPEATLTICGLAPDRRVLALRAIPGVTVTGAVPDVRPYLHRAAVGIVPLRIARGIQNKLLEALATGLPCVATSAARGGIEAEAGRDVAIADEPAAFAAEVVQLLQSESRRTAMGAAARAAVEANYHWDKTLAELEDICVEAAGVALTPTAGGR